jgi:hypothetical protein
MFNKNLYNNPYHQEDISKLKFLITGGAGFIGSNLVELEFLTIFLTDILTTLKVLLDFQILNLLKVIYVI